MSDFLLSFIRSSLDLFNVDIFVFSFVAFLFVYALGVIHFLFWGE